MTDDGLSAHLALCHLAISSRERRPTSIHSIVHPDDHICLCYRVSLRKVRAYLARENPPVASLISECLDAGTGCGWCVPTLQKLHAEHAAGREPALSETPEQYAAAREVYKKTGHRSN